MTYELRRVMEMLTCLPDGGVGPDGATLDELDEAAGDHHTIGTPTCHILQTAYRTLERLVVSPSDGGPMMLALHIDGTTIGSGALSLWVDGNALFFGGESGRDMLGHMERAKVDFIGANGLQLSGFEWTGQNDRIGKKIYAYSEWWLTW